MSQMQRLIDYGLLYAGNQHKGYYNTVSPALQKRLRSYQKRMRRKPTEAETRFKQILTEYFNIRTPQQARRIFTQQKQFHISPSDKPEKGYIGDFYLIRHRILFEIDGSNHNSPRQRRYDQLRDHALQRNGIKTIRITNEQTLDHELCKSIIRNAINGKPKKRPTINISRTEELKLQAEYIEKHGTTRIRNYGYKYH